MLMCCQLRGRGTGVQQDLALYGLTKLYNILSMKVPTNPLSTLQAEGLHLVSIATNDR